MQNSLRFSSLISLAVAACAAIASVSVCALDAVVAFGRFAKAWVVGKVKAVLSVFAEPQHLPRPVIQLVQACAYATRIAKRQRPQVMTSWRMCPSI